MKFKRKVLVMFLTMAVLSGIMGVNVGANQFNVTINPNPTAINAGAAHNEREIYMREGDTVYFNFVIAASAPRNMRFGIVNTNGTFVADKSTSGTTFSDTLTVPSDGRYRVRIRNNGTTNASVAGYYRHTTVYRARVRYDVYYGGHPNVVSNATTAFNQATSAFPEKHGIRFPLNSVQSASALNGHACPDTNLTERCNTTSCGTITSCSTNHHKSAWRLMGVSASSNYHTIRIVGHAICHWEFGATQPEHYGTSVSGAGLGGAAHPDTKKDSIVTSRSNTSLNVIIQHELSHNLGAEHCGNRCIMNSKNVELNRWCTSCTTRIKNNR